MFQFYISCTEYKILAAFTICREICGYSAVLKIKPQLVQYRHTQPGILLKLSTLIIALRTTLRGTLLSLNDLEGHIQ